MFSVENLAKTKEKKVKPTHDLILQDTTVKIWCILLFSPLNIYIFTYAQIDVYSLLFHFALILNISLCQLGDFLCCIARHIHISSHFLLIFSL